MIAAIASFVKVLRRDGIAVSQAEVLDAIRALEAVGLDDRELVRGALRVCLVKHHGNRSRFDHRFDEHFAAPGLPPRRAKGRREGSAGGSGDRGREGDGRSAGRQQRDTPSRPSTVARPRRSARAARPQTEGRQTTRLRRIVSAERPPTESRRDGERSALPSQRPLDRRFTVEEERELAAAVPRLVERIRLRAGRRRQRASRGGVDLRGLFRANLSHGGVPWVIPRHRRRPRRRRVVVLVDVSWSAARAAGLFLSLAAAFVDRSRRTRVALFVDRPVDATTEVERWLASHPGGAATSGSAASGRFLPGRGIVRGGRSFAGLLEGVEGLNLTAPSDYGRVFDSLPRVMRAARGRDAMLVILGDGRTNRFDPQAWRFEEIASGFGAVLWLVPEPRRRWGTDDSALDRYLDHVDVAVEAHDLEGLAHGVAEWVCRL